MRLMIFLFALLLSQALMARPYQVELIIFSQPSERGMQNEYWPWINPIDPPTNARLGGSEALPALPESKNHLNLIARHISQAPGYQVLTHRSWIQEMTDRPGKPVYLVANPYTIGTGGADRPTKAPLYQVTATLSFSVNRYIDLAMDLVIRDPLSANHQQKNTYHSDDRFTYYEIKQKRRTKSGTLNYLDHPHIGVLIQFTPVPTA